MTSGKDGRFVRRLRKRIGWLSDLVATAHLWRNLSYLRRVGWFLSYRRGLPVDKGGAPLPWYTHASIAFLKERVRSPMSVFEYGSGNSTLWWSQRVGRVVSCEHDRAWFEHLRSALPDTVEYVLCESLSNGEYAATVEHYHQEFDVILIDGRDRVRCARNCLEALKPAGVIVWDNTNREEYQPGFKHLATRGFRRIDFCGLGPTRIKGWCTSVFYRQENCIGI